MCSSAFSPFQSTVFTIVALHRAFLHYHHRIIPSFCLGNCILVIILILLITIHHDFPFYEQLNSFDIYLLIYTLSLFLDIYPDRSFCESLEHIVCWYCSLFLELLHLRIATTLSFLQLSVSKWFTINSMSFILPHCPLLR